VKLLSTSEVLESNTVSLFTRNQTRSLFVLDMQVLTGNIQGRKADSQGGFQRKPRDKTTTCCSCLLIQLGSLGISPNTMMGSLAMLLLISSDSSVLGMQVVTVLLYRTTALYTCTEQLRCKAFQNTCKQQLYRCTEQLLKTAVQSSCTVHLYRSATLYNCNKTAALYKVTLRNVTVLLDCSSKKD
jgi:hypothetical protein